MPPDAPGPTHTRLPTLRDVAKRAGVSMMTVSNVINGRTARVSNDTRDRILAAIESLGYRPQRRGRGLRMQREYAIGLTIVRPDRRFLDDPYLTEVAAGMSNGLVDAGFGLMINGATDPAALGRLIARTAAVDALAVFASGPREVRRDVYRVLEQLHHPIAIIQDDEPELPDSCCFIQDDEGGARALTRDLLKAGAKRLLFVGPDRIWPAVERREAGARAEAEGCASVSSITCNEADFIGSIADIGRAIDRDGVPDAIIGANDQIGIAAIRAAGERGLAVPGDLMVTGFNAFPFREFSVPLISSIRSPAYAIGEAVAQGLLTRIDGTAFADRRHVLPVEPAPGATVRAAG